MINKQFKLYYLDIINVHLSITYINKVKSVFHCFLVIIVRIIRIEIYIITN